MHSRNQWGGSFELSSGEVVSGYEISPAEQWDKAALLEQPRRDETLQSWILERSETKRKKSKYVDFGCIVLSHKALKWIFGSIFVAFCVIGLPIIIAHFLPKHHAKPIPPDNYTLALHKALRFFNAQKCKYLAYTILYHANYYHSYFPNCALFLLKCIFSLNLTFLSRFYLIN